MVSEVGVVLEVDIRSVGDWRLHGAGWRGHETIGIEPR